ncbi:MAG: trypsin-like peptidase domain-containing protein [Flavobacteriales bacterium]|nr:trypsin-like peptidase domain-containing protein [Flavobacteriales bacterium]
MVLATAVLASWFFSRHFSRSNKQTVYVHDNGAAFNPIVRAANQNVSDVNFISASKKSTPTVVFIKTESQVQRRSSFWFFDFDPFGSIGKVSSTGSGVIISSDGYIVTNHHVVQNADKIEVVIGGKRSYQAKVIGDAPSSDLALLKIEAENLPFIEVANSDEVEIGEWVLAVGNPFNLNSTVTAGIVSAKGRNINIVRNEFPIESFIQTDAAINPGNSGGALVNLEGKLIGVNTAIASKTGSYVGYGFAIPSNIVLKIVNDLREFGEIQRGFDGLEVTDLEQSSSQFERYDGSGVEVKGINGLNDGLRNQILVGDVILAMNGKKIYGLSDYNEIIARHRPGDAIRYTIGRDGKSIEKEIVLVNQDGGTGRYVRKVSHSQTLGADFEPITKLERERYGIDYGFRISNIGQGRIRNMNIPEGFVLTVVNGNIPDTVQEAIRLLENARGQLRIEGVSPNGGKQVMSFYMY